MLFSNNNKKKILDEHLFKSYFFPALYCNYWCEDHQEVKKFKVPCPQEKYFIENTTCSPEKGCSPLSMRRKRWISYQELARSIRHSAQEKGIEFGFQKSNWIFTRGKLLVRSRICCCKPCLKRNWQNCELKVCLCAVGLCEKPSYPIYNILHILTEPQCAVTLYDVQCTYWNLM